jgi:hypothetical protein
VEGRHVGLDSYDLLIEAIEAAVETTKPSEPPVQKVAQGDLASLQVVTRVNAEQASKNVMQEPTQL